MFFYVCDLAVEVFLTKTKPFIVTSRPYSASPAMRPQNPRGHTLVHTNDTFYTPAARPSGDVNMLAENNDGFESLAYSIGLI